MSNQHYITIFMHGIHNLFPWREENQTNQYYGYVYVDKYYLYKCG